MSMESFKPSPEAASKKPSPEELANKKPSPEKNVNKKTEGMSDEELEQNNISNEYLREYNIFKNLNESYQQKLRVLDSLRKESNLSIDNNADLISSLEKELSALSSSIDASQGYMSKLFDKLSPESRNKYLRAELFEKPSSEETASKKPLETASKNPSSEEVAKINKERFNSDKELIMGGAEYDKNELRATPEQIEKAKQEMEEEIKKQEAEQDKQRIENLAKPEKEIFDLVTDYLKTIENFSDKDKKKEDNLWKLLLHRIEQIKLEYNNKGDTSPIFDLAEREFKRQKEKGEIEKSAVKEERENPNEKEQENPKENKENKNENVEEQYNSLYKTLESLVDSYSLYKYEKQMDKASKIEQEINKQLPNLVELRKKLVEEQPELANWINIPEKMTVDDFRKESAISKASDFRDLVSNVMPRIVGNIIAPDGHVYTIDKLQEAINKVRTGEWEVYHITRMYGLRGKVKELLDRERENRR